MMPIFDAKFATSGEQKFPQNWDKINFIDATFNYNPSSEHSTNQLDQVSISIKKGQKIGIVGRSGSGKSTLAKILLGLYQLNSGMLEIGGVNFYDIKTSERTNHISTVLQETELFSLSMLENITMMREVSPFELQQAINIAHLQPIIDKLPEKLQTQIGEKGYKLSGGERQRIGIARAICSGADILVLDEATSALDSQTETLIQSALDQQLEGRTVITIAHRLSTLRSSDRIFVFENGHVKEYGDFDQLLANTKSSFYALYKGQSQ